ncbi:MAG: PepSY-associated TM helix domain-containing protein [Novosphingobium sp.]
MKDTFRQSMAWLHTWAGLVLGWVLFFVFVTGTLSYVRFEIDRWMMPERPMATATPPAAESLPRAVAYLERHFPDAQSWTIFLPMRRLGHDLYLVARPWPGSGDTEALALDPATGLPDEVKVRDTGGGGHLYEMHYQLHYIPYDIGIRLVAICAMFMLIATLTGVVVHKKIFKDFFTFRPGKGQRSWLDAHNLLGVTALPFHIMISWSGLVFFLFTYMPAGPAILHGDTGQRVAQETAASPAPVAPQRAARAAMVPIDTIVSQVEKRWGKSTSIGRIVVTAPGQMNGEITVYPGGRGNVEKDYGSLTFRAATGVLLRDEQGASLPVARTQDVLVSLHAADFAGPALRAIFVLVGLASAGMIATGLVLWTAKRRAKQGSTFGFRLVETLNIGAIAGLPVAIAAYFWANRLLPLNLPERHDWEIHVLFLTWAALLVWPIWRPARRAWVELLSVGACAFGFLPVLNALTTDCHLGVSIPAGDWVMAGFDLIALLIGAAFVLAARKAATPPAPSARSRTRPRTVAEAL